MGCACNHQDIVAEKNNEMKETIKEEPKNNEESNINTFLINSNMNENDTFNESNKLRGAPPQAGFDNNITINDNSNREENKFHEVETDKIDLKEFNQLEIDYPKKNDDVIVEMRNPQESKENQVIYYGEWDKNKNVRHGRGIQIWPDGARYSGYWINDKACGKGKLVHSDGDIYMGEWSNDKPNGYGIYIHSDGTKYEGYWMDDKQNGEGKESWPDGASYEGQYKDGKKNGEGKFFWSDGSTYEGHFENNNINGNGTYIFADKRKYIGSWVNNKLDGKGVFLWPDGRKYDGEYKNDKKEGFGIFEWSNGKKYKGYWKDGKQDGEGEFYFPTDNKWKKGIWEKGKRVKWIADYF